MHVEKLFKKKGGGGQGVQKHAHKHKRQKKALKETDELVACTMTRLGKEGDYLGLNVAWQVPRGLRRGDSVKARFFISQASQPFKANKHTNKWERGRGGGFCVF